MASRDVSFYREVGSVVVLSYRDECGARAVAPGTPVDIQTVPSCTDRERKGP
jgi:hypothetical protein